MFKSRRSRLDRLEDRIEELGKEIARHSRFCDYEIVESELGRLSQSFEEFAEIKAGERVCCHCGNVFVLKMGPGDFVSPSRGFRCPCCKQEEQR